ncbi:alpha/beta hydrolase [Pantoea vagans]|uniref:alpha/beta hydrolase n=1 Tax=Pantoea vagans TaxID=470934 RepID=UPI00301A3E4A
MIYPSDFRVKPGFTSRLIILVASLLFALTSHARPDMSPLGPNIADRGSSFYHFSEKQFTSADGKRLYRVWVGVPDKRPPASGYAVMYMLDGNAVMDRLSEPLLKEMSGHTPPVLVIVGYQTSLPFALDARAYDDTPAVQQTAPGRVGGGSQIFRQLLEGTIAPAAESDLKIDNSQRGIWGHSLGGIFVLDNYLSGSSFFSYFYTTSPSFNRNYVGMLNDLEAIRKSSLCKKQLYMMEGSAQRSKNPQAPDPDVVEKAHTTLRVLKARGLPVDYWSYPGNSHGQMFDLGFQQTLKHFAADKQPISCQQ